MISLHDTRPSHSSDRVIQHWKVMVVLNSCTISQPVDKLNTYALNMHYIQLWSCTYSWQNNWMSNYRIQTTSTLHYTVEALYSGHPWGATLWPLYRVAGLQKFGYYESLCSLVQSRPELLTDIYTGVAIKRGSTVLSGKNSFCHLQAHLHKSWIQVRVWI